MKYLELPHLKGMGGIMGFNLMATLTTIWKMFGCLRKGQVKVTMKWMSVFVSMS